jgi:hypothetical protein
VLRHEIDATAAQVYGDAGADVHADLQRDRIPRRTPALSRVSSNLSFAERAIERCASPGGESARQRRLLGLLPGEDDPADPQDCGGAGERFTHGDRFCGRQAPRPGCQAGDLRLQLPLIRAEVGQQKGEHPKLRASGDEPRLIEFSAGEKQVGARDRQDAICRQGRAARSAVRHVHATAGHRRRWRR